VSHSMTLQQVAQACSDAGNRLPLPAGGANNCAFTEPWQAQAFAMTLVLHARGAFSWTRWATALACEIAAARSAGQNDDGTGYYKRLSLSKLSAQLASCTILNTPGKPLRRARRTVRRSC